MIRADTVDQLSEESPVWLREFDPDVATAYWRVIRLTGARAERAWHGHWIEPGQIAPCLR